MSAIALVWIPLGGLALGLALSVFSYRHFHEMGRMMGTGAGIIICNLVFLGGIYRSVPGLVLFALGAFLAMISTFATVRENRRRIADVAQAGNRVG